MNMSIRNKSNKCAASVSCKTEPITCDYDEAVELTGHGCYNYLLLAACCVINNASAIDMFGFSVVVAAATCDLQLGVTEAGLLASIPFAGVLFAFPWGYYADTRGRRGALLLSTAVGFTMAAASSLAPTWQAMLVIKLLGSIFSTAAFTLTMTFLGECTGSQRRSRYLNIMNGANLAADVVYFLLAFFFLNLDFLIPIPWLSITYRPWRLYTLILAAPLGLGALMTLPLHESPKFLASRGEENKALEVLRDIFKRNGGNKGEYPVHALSISEISAKQPFWSGVVNQTMPLFRPPLLWRTVQLFLLMAICCSTNNTFLMWYPLMVNIFFKSISGGDTIDNTSFCQRIVANISAATDTDNYICNDTISTNTIYSGIILGLVFTSLTLLAATVASWRRLVIIASFLTSAICLLLVEVVRDPVGNLVVFTLVQTTAVGIGGVASYFIDLYPTSCRGLVTSLGMMFSRLVSLGGVNVVGAVIVDHCTLTFYFWTGVVCFGIVLAIFLPSDKKSTSSLLSCSRFKKVLNISIVDRR